MDHYNEWIIYNSGQALLHPGSVGSGVLVPYLWAGCIARLSYLASTLNLFLVSKPYQWSQWRDLPPLGQSGVSSRSPRLALATRLGFGVSEWLGTVLQSDVRWRHEQPGTVNRAVTSSTTRDYSVTRTESPVRFCAIQSGVSFQNCITQ